ncbi:MAG: Ig-like domain-containing protein [Candidatus Pacebacteria bacterium]|nr:Ig-like domain-containing protein [Candidatus Paceibacterota bacterium]
MKKLAFVLSFLIIFLFSATEIKAANASLFFEPAAGNYEVYSQFSVKIKVDSDGAPINASKATISFPANILEVVSVSKSGSIFQLWPEEPVFSNSQGKITYGGGVPAPGFTGVGTILVVNFRGKVSGTAKVSISDALVLAADGRGTDILTSVSDGNYKIEKGVPVTPGLPEKPKISSNTHPKENSWYNNSNPEFLWNISSEIIGVSTEFDQKSQTQPKQKSEGIFNSEKFEKTEDGIWYFHLKVQNNVGWSETAHYRVQIDTKSPGSFDIRIDNEGDLANPNPDLYFEAKDELSGISHYEIKIDDKDTFSVVPADTNPYHVPFQSPGTYEITIKALDKAGNTVKSETILEVESIEPPKILIYPKTYISGKDTFYIEGTALPNSTILIFLESKENKAKNWEAKSDKDGNWSFTTEEFLKSGNYALYARTRNAKGAISNPSPSYSVKVILSGIAIGPFIFTYSTFFSALIVLLILMAIFLILLILRKNRKEKDRLIKETREAAESLKKNFEKLRKDLELRIEYFDSKPGLSPDEKKLRDRLFYFLKSSEDAIRKEIEDIEKELK